MDTDRRGLLRLAAGAVVGLAATATACRPSGDPAPGAGAPTDPHAPAPVPAPRFAGDPPPGHLYYGASLPASRSLTQWEDQLGARLSLHRSYFKPDDNETTQLLAQCRDDIAHGRLPHVSTKPTWSWRSIATGRHDDWLTRLLTALGSEATPVFLTVHHEPENDAGPDGMTPPDFVAMQERVVRYAAELAPQVTVVPVYQYWTFDPLREGGDDPRDWIVGAASIAGLDIYNPWSASNGKRWRSFGSKVSEVLPWFEGTPVAIGEHGCRVDPANPGLAAEWLRDAADFARRHGIVSMSYFNSHVNSPDGTWALQEETERAFGELLRADWVARTGQPASTAR